MFYHTVSQHKLAVLSIPLMLSLSACSSAPALDNDPLEPMNRKIYAFNKTADKYVVKPIAKGYDAVFPAPVKTGVTNFFNNIQDIPIAINGLLQGRPQDMASDVVRVLINTTFGLLGVIDAASYVGVERHEADFGQTLGKWGIKSSPYLVLASTVRDGIGLGVDWAMSPWPWIEPESLAYGLYALDGINTRRNYLDKEELINVAAFDEYVAIRNAYLQNRQNRINAGGSDTDEFGDDGF